MKQILKKETALYFILNPPKLGSKPVKIAKRPIILFPKLYLANIKKKLAIK